MNEPLESAHSTRSASDRALLWLLRLIGASSLTALVFVAAPGDWMRDIHAGLGMGDLPRLPVIGYLARSTSAFYALLGGLLWLVSFDLPRYRTVITYLGASFFALGVILLAVDTAEGMPRWWTLWEGPFIAVYGVAVCVLNRRAGRS